MTTQLVPWIGRQLADELFKKIKSKTQGVHIYVVRADAGMGKTYLARDLGTAMNPAIRMTCTGPASSTITIRTQAIPSVSSRLG